jgi:hypothetical protein
MTLRSRFITTAVASSLLLAPLTIAAPAFAGKGGAFIGGMLTSRVLNNMNRRTQAQEYQAYSAPRAQPVQQAAPASSGGQSAEARIKQLDKLAAGGYITPAEYKSKKKAILDSL